MFFIGLWPIVHAISDNEVSTKNEFSPWTYKYYLLNFVIWEIFVCKTWNCENKYLQSYKNLYSYKKLCIKVIEGTESGK